MKIFIVSTMTGLAPSLYDRLLQPSQDVYDLWYQRNINLYDHGQYQQPTQPAKNHHPTAPNQQQERYDNYDQLMASNMPQNHFPPTTAPPPVKQSESLEKTPSEKRMHALMKNRDGNSNCQSDKVFKRRPGACTRCRRVKMKCNLAPGEKTCQRCKPKGYHCVVEAPRTRVYEREHLLTEIRQKDAIIETLMKQLHNPYLTTSHSIDEYLKSVSSDCDANNPDLIVRFSRLKSDVQIGLGRILEASDEDSGQKRHEKCNIPTDSKVQEHEEMPTAFIRSCVPVGFRPEPMVTSQTEKEQEHGTFPRDVFWEVQEIASELGLKLGDSKGHGSPEIRALGLVTVEDAEQLFDIFYKYINPFIAVFDPILLTPKSTLARCPVLFTVICAIASRYHPRKTNIYRIAMHFAKKSAANALIHDEIKSVELCQAYILMSIYTIPERSWDRDQTWLYTGLAISIAIALRLDQTPKINLATESEEREYLNRVRVWKFCFLLDQATAMQFGKPGTMKDDTSIRHSREWYQQSPYNLDYDVYLCGYNVLIHIVAKFYQKVRSDESRMLNFENGNLLDAIMSYDMEIEMFKDEWKRKLKVGGVHRGAMFLRSMLDFYVAHFKLVMFSFGFHQVVHAGIEAWYDYFFTKSFEYAKSVIRCMNENLAPSGFMRHAPDHHFMWTAFAVVFLFKLLRPQFSSLLHKADKEESVELIKNLINKLSASDIAVDNRHTPKLYARFFVMVLENHRPSDQEMAFEGSLTNSSVNAGASWSLTEEMDEKSGGNCEKISVAQGYTSARVTYLPEATHELGNRPMQFGSVAGLLHAMDGIQNINGNNPPGNIEDEMIMSLQNLDNTEWFQGMVMPRFTQNSSGPEFTQH
ncbi:hypothetical protein EDD18DRAFT_681233 [Armillaria luteobubalina]|uniref:Zn(2)-C6 fungal-type domain-containing protein n=1 Tax=Armillaria luteobubalina TaxID=153913 RepID=A0AA39UXM8_9AGAR|nr:hypothetical protein EDD18DRAFT_681233 [Armillaria luteobubalina]